MDAHDGAVDHLHLAVVRLGDGVHQAIPDARHAPAVEAVVGGRVGPVTLGQIAPRRARAQHPEDPVQHAPIVLAARAGLAPGQKGFDDAPLEVGQIVAHDPSSDVSNLESLFASPR